jgi:phytoene dehydrogenase-like protein
MYDAVIVGAGPNGLSAAITLVKAGLQVLVLEKENTIGGGLRSRQLTLPGFQHDVCATVLAMALCSPALRDLPLEEFGLEWVYPPIPLAHPLDNGRAVLLHRSVEHTAEGLGEDGPAYRRLFTPFIDRWQDLMRDFLGPLPLPPRNPWLMACFGWEGLRPASRLARATFKTEAARGFFAGLAGHSMLRLETPASAAFGLMLGISAHAVGWPLVKGGSQNYANALSALLRSIGGEIETGFEVRRLDDLPDSKAVLLDVNPRAVLKIAGDRLTSGYARSLKRYRFGPGVCKVDYALSGPIPWQAEACSRAGTIHLGCTLDEIAASERAAWQGKHIDKPYVLLVQATTFDPSRAPVGKHTVWAYCHVPHASSKDVSERISDQIERFAPGFRDLILAKHVYSAAQMEMYNPNYVGGDINSGVQDLFQLFTRPAPRLNPYRTPVKGVYMCSSSTPPGGGVHGMGGYHSAKTVLKEIE